MLNVNEKRNKFDSIIFENNDEKCNGLNNCSYVTRIMTALSYYDQVSPTNPEEFVDFCNKYYSSQYLQDYIHFICTHKNDTDKAQNTQNKQCMAVSGCLKTQRHYRDRTRTTLKNTNVSQSRYIDLFDSLHFYVYHMAECGLRVSINKLNDDHDDIEEFKDDMPHTMHKDETIKELYEEIQAKKNESGLFPATKYSKFNIMHNNYGNVCHTDDNEDKKDDEKYGAELKVNNKQENDQKMTILHKFQHAISKYFPDKNDKQPATDQQRLFPDDMIDYIRSSDKTAQEETLTYLKEFLLIEEYDTDAIEDDIDIYVSEKNCNL
eukprot:183197_1